MKPHRCLVPEPFKRSKMLVVSVQAKRVEILMVEDTVSVAVPDLIRKEERVEVDPACDDAAWVDSVVARTVPTQCVASQAINRDRG